MILTEEEAKTKRCQEGFGMPLYNSTATQSPEAMVATALYGAGFAVIGSPSHCIGSACMAWRWHKPPEEIALDSIPLVDLLMSSRTTNALAPHGVKTIGDFKGKSQAELLRYPNFGYKSFNEVVEVIRQRTEEVAHRLIPSGFCGKAGKP